MVTEHFFSLSVNLSAIWDKPLTIGQITYELSHV